MIINFDVFLLIPLTLRAKIPPFPRKNMEKNLTGWSLGTICLFKQKKIMVGHFEVGRYFHGRARDSVKIQPQPFLSTSTDFIVSAYSKVSNKRADLLREQDGIFLKKC